MDPEPLPEPSTGLFSRPYRSCTTAVASVFALVALTELALGTVMPTAVRDLDGLSLYALVFGGCLTAGIVGTVVGGDRADRTGPGPVLYAGLACLALGALAAGLATTILPFLLGRCIQGAGGGAVTVALYTVVGRAYPASLRPRMFSLVTACWILPSMLGPPVVGTIAQHTSWRWVFHAIAALAAGATLLFTRPLRRLPPPAPEATGRPAARIRPALTVAAGAGLLQYAGTDPGWRSLPFAAGGLALVAVSVRALLPRGTLRARGGLPALVLLRGVAAGAYFTAESFIPLMLVDERRLSPAAAGTSLTGAALTWAAASWLQARPGLRLPRRRVVAIGALVHFGAAVLTIGGVLREAPAVTAALGLALAGFGMGLLLPGVGVLTLELSERNQQGANSAALQLADSLCSVLLIGLCGAVFNTAHTRPGQDAGAFALVFTVVAAVAGLACVLAGRITTPLTKEEAHAPL
ncbi:MFS transporter [Streptomyces sp. NPDC052396]|uniref:MFS transporter n=1 Tax=Streptomyces sp. NPDC052396 TaxID=3365689 RepID=UPI0037D45A64